MMMVIVIMTINNSNRLLYASYRKSPERSQTPTGERIHHIHTRVHICTHTHARTHMHTPPPRAYTHAHTPTRVRTQLHTIILECETDRTAAVLLRKKKNQQRKLVN